jgi:ABC-2 type transport system ATP-binding protein
MAEVERLCERVIFLSHGRVVADGRPEEIALRFGRSDLEGVFLHLADERRPAPEQLGTQQTDHA